MKPIDVIYLLGIPTGALLTYGIMAVSINITWLGVISGFIMMAFYTEGTKS